VEEPSKYKIYNKLRSHYYKIGYNYQVKILYVGGVIIKSERRMHVEQTSRNLYGRIVGRPRRYVDAYVNLCKYV
jgi:vacuolar-type H+-ATPase subunit E/Vma4